MPINDNGSRISLRHKCFPINRVEFLVRCDYGKPVDIDVWVTLAGIALILAVAMELHKLSWGMRRSRNSE